MSLQHKGEQRNSSALVEFCTRVSSVVLRLSWGCGSIEGREEVNDERVASLYKETNWEVKEQRPEGLQIAPRYHVTWIMFKNRNLPSASRPSVNDHSHGKEHATSCVRRPTDCTQTFHEIGITFSGLRVHEPLMIYEVDFLKFLINSWLSRPCNWMRDIYTLLWKLFVHIFVLITSLVAGKLLRKRGPTFHCNFSGPWARLNISALLIVTPMHFSAKSMQSAMLKDLW